MTERKPANVSMETWVERQIREAQQKGAFDNLPGHGKPIPRGASEDSSWLRGYLRREELSSDALLPTPLQLRKQIERLPTELLALRSERHVRDRIDELNVRIRDWIRNPTGPQIPIGLVDVEGAVDDWRSARVAIPAAPETQGEQPISAPRRRWFGRRANR